MSERYVYVYRLIVELPEGSQVPGWEPPDWPEICGRHGWGWGGGIDGPSELPPFRWPRRRLYLNVEAAVKRARMLREMGATVRVEASRADDWKPWPEWIPAAPANREAR